MLGGIGGATRAVQRHGAAFGRRGGRLEASSVMPPGAHLRLPFRAARLDVWVGKRLQVVPTLMHPTIAETGFLAMVEFQERRKRM